MAGELIVLADDYEIIRTFLSRALLKAGYRVLLATDGAAALAHCAADACREIRLLVADQNMPSLKGLELARELERTRPDIRSIVVSGDDLEGDMAPGDRVSFLRKPFTVEDLLVVMRAALPP